MHENPLGNFLYVSRDFRNGSSITAIEKSITIINGIFENDKTFPEKILNPQNMKNKGIKNPAIPNILSSISEIYAPAIPP